MSLNQDPVKRKKAKWSDKNIEIMLKVCIEEVIAGNKPHNHFTKLGLGWDGEKKTIAASDEWWEAKIQEDPEVTKFRKQGLKFLPEMEFLFKGTIATGFAAYAPSEDSRQ
ncbi:hypothetical protein AAZX31_01G061000 [Glycine max]